MALVVRELELAEIDLIIDYFHSSTPEHLEMLDVDPTRLPSADRWRERDAADYARPHAKRFALLVLWEQASPDRLTRPAHHGRRDVMPSRAGLLDRLQSLADARSGLDSRSRLLSAPPAFPAPASPRETTRARRAL